MERKRRGKKSPPLITASLRRFVLTCPQIRQGRLLGRNGGLAVLRSGKVCLCRWKCICALKRLKTFPPVRSSALQSPVIYRSFAGAKHANEIKSRLGVD